MSEYNNIDEITEALHDEWGGFFIAYYDDEMWDEPICYVRNHTDEGLGTEEKHSVAAESPSAALEKAREYFLEESE